MEIPDNDNNKPDNNNEQLLEQCPDYDHKELLALTDSYKIHVDLRKPVILLHCANNVLSIKEERSQSNKRKIQHNQHAEESRKIIKEIKKFEKDPEEYETNDPTNFAAAELGFLIEVQTESDNKRIKYYHFPVKIPDKSIFNIYDNGKEKVDEFIRRSNNKIAKPVEDYHSEAALFFLCMKTSFQEEMINKLIEKLSKKKNLKRVTLQKLILEIHSRRDMCQYCYDKAKCIFNWKDEQDTEPNENMKQFLKPFEETFLELLKKENIPVQKLKELEVFIIFSYDQEYNDPAPESNHYFIRLKKDLIDCAILSQYSIFASGGSSTRHENYPRIYNKVVKLASKHGVKN